MPGDCARHSEPEVLESVVAAIVSNKPEEVKKWQALRVKNLNVAPMQVVVKPSGIHTIISIGGCPMPIHDWTRVEAGDFHHFHN